LLTGIHIINLGKTWEKLVLAARIIAAIENVSGNEKDEIAWGLFIGFDLTMIIFFGIL
jgi:hypothetical protein